MEKKFSGGLEVLALPFFVFSFRYCSFSEWQRALELLVVPHRTRLVSCCCSVIICASVSAPVSTTSSKAISQIPSGNLPFRCHSIALLVV